jgi:RNA polymerase sigma factor (sigma-70 family)
MSNDIATLAAPVRFENFHTLHNAWVLALLIRLTRNGDRAADIAQSVWLKIFENWEFLEPRILGSGAAWLRVIVVRAFYDDTRGRHCRPIIPFDDLAPAEREIRDPSPDPFKRAADAEQRRILNDLLEGFTPADRALADAVAVQELSMRDAARALGVTTSSVVSRWFRMRRKLAALATDKGLR